METSKVLYMKNRLFKTFFPALVLALATAAGLNGIWTVIGAARADQPAAARTGEPIHITSDRLVTDSLSNSAQFSGSVRAVQGQSVLTADRLTLIFDSKKDGAAATEPGEGATDIKRIEAWGNVRIEFDNRVAVGEHAVYITDERKLVLNGPGAKVISGKDEVVGSKITFFRDDGRLSMEGDGQNRVKAILHSGQRGLN